MLEVGREEAVAGAGDDPDRDRRPGIEVAHRLEDGVRLRPLVGLTGGGDLNVREQLEEVQLQRAHQQVEIADRRAEQEKSAEAAELAQRMATQANQVELEIYAARSAREPGNTSALGDRAGAMAKGQLLMTKDQ